MTGLQVEDKTKTHKILTNGQSNLGEFILDVDGYWVYFPNPERGGYYNEWFLHELLQILENLNRDWDEQVKKGLEKCAES